MSPTGPCCRECGSFAEVDETGLCWACRRVEQQITRSYQRREEYRSICPLCGRGMTVMRSMYYCPWCCAEVVSPAYEHRNATKNPSMGLPDEHRRPTLRDIVALYGPPRGRG